MIPMWKGFPRRKPPSQHKVLYESLVAKATRHIAIMLLTHCVRSVYSISQTPISEKHCRNNRLYVVQKWNPYVDYSFLPSFIFELPHRSPVNAHHKGQWRGALMTSLICAWIKAWINNRDAGDLRGHRTDYDVTVTSFQVLAKYTNHIYHTYHTKTPFCRFIALGFLSVSLIISKQRLDHWRKMSCLPSMSSLVSNGLFWRWIGGINEDYGQ